MKNIYIIFTNLGTNVGGVIKLKSQMKFWNRVEGYHVAHVSLSLDDKFDNMKSFARKGIYNVFNAGLVRESINEGLFKKYSENGRIEIAKIAVTEEQYEALKNLIERDWENKEKFKYDYLSFLTLAIFQKGLDANKNRFVCSQYVAELLFNSGILSRSDCNLDKKDIQPFNLYSIYMYSVVFKGVVEELKVKVQEAQGDRWVDCSPLVYVQ